MVVVVEVVPGNKMSLILIWTERLTRFININPNCGGDINVACVEKLSDIQKEFFKNGILG